MRPDDLCELLGIGFSDQQLAAITAPLAPGVIVAGAGSGKTTAMAARVVWLVGTGQVRPDQVLGLTFTKKAAAELDARIRASLARQPLKGPGLKLASNEPEDEDPGEPVVSTYHAFAGALITEHGLRLGVEPDVRVLADATRYQLAGRVVRRSKGPIRHASHHVPTLVTSLLALDGELADHLVRTADVRAYDEAVRAEVAAVAKPVAGVRTIAETALKRAEILQLVEEYQALKADRGVLDFADQMALGARLAEECPEVGRIERDRYRVVLLDEYQDTSVSQRRMLSALFSGGHPVTAVGDPCQAIYGWRGASVANLDDFPEHFPAVDGTPAERFVLSVNRRCGSGILAAANEHAAPLYEHHPGVEALTAPDDARPGGITVGLFETRSAEVAWVADAIVAAHNTPGRRWKDIGVLMRTNADLSAVHTALVERGVPVEVVGLGGLLALPEVVDVVSVLQAVNDLTANAAMLRILTGPRYRIGPRDLALLANRAKVLAHAERHRIDPDDLVAALDLATSGMDSTEVISLAEAVDDPGGEDWQYDPAARERFAELSTELRGLRAHAGEPLIDLVRRVVATIGLDVELAATPEHVAASRRDHLAAFLDAVGSFASTETGDGAGSLDGLLSYLAAEEEYAAGLDLAVPSEADSVKLLTAHRAKGLEWPVVFVPALAATVFPSDRGRSKWTTNARTLPWPLRGDGATLPDVRELTNPALKEFAAACKDNDLLEERRLGYVAFTRAKDILVATGHWWGPTQKRPRGPSAYLELLRKHATREVSWADRPEADAENPELRSVTEVAWPAPSDPGRHSRRLEAADLVRTSRENGPQADEAELLLDEQATVARWDSELERLVAEARESRSRTDLQIALPGTLSATQVMRLAKDPDGLATDLARPMPRKPNRAARFGTRFHAWVESYFGQQLLLDPDDLPGAADSEIVDDTDLTELMDAFRNGPYGEQTPYEIEAPFALALGGRVVRGRIDAVYRTSRGYDVIDWKTHRRETADPLQLAIYRLAWAELEGIPLDRIGAAFYYVRTGDVVRPDLPGRDELLVLLDGDHGDRVGR